MPKTNPNIGRVLWIVPFVAALAPIVLMTVYADRIATESVRQLTAAQQLSIAQNLAQHTTIELNKATTLSMAFSSVEGTVQSTRDRDAFIQNLRLKTLIVAYPQMKRSIIVDTGGRVLAAYPVGSGALTTDGPWSAGMTLGAKQQVTGVYADPLPAFAIVTPIADSGGTVGHLVTELPTEPLSQWIAQIELPHRGSLFLLDHRGHVLARPGTVGDLKTYADLPGVREALNGTAGTVVYTDPVTEEETIATLQPIPVGGARWIAVAQQPVTVASGAATRVRLLMVLGGIVLTFVAIWLIIALARASAKIITLNRDLEEKNKKLEEADRMKDDFISFVSHQLKAPVTSIRLGVEALLKEQLGHLPDGAKHTLEQLKDISAQSFKLITDLLNTSRINRGVIDVDVQDTPLKDVVERSVRDYRIPVQNAGLELKLEGTEQDIHVMVDKEKMAEAVSNAISNAIKHTKQGSITVKMYAMNGHGCIDVTDTGEGMTPEIMSKLFTRDQIFGTSAHAEHSAGLGLYIAKHFMALQKGDVTVTSQIGKGSTFTYRIPLKNG